MAARDVLILLAHAPLFAAVAFILIAGVPRV